MQCVRYTRVSSSEANSDAAHKVVFFQLLFLSTTFELTRVCNALLLFLARSIDGGERLVRIRSSDYAWGAGGGIRPHLGPDGGVIHHGEARDVFKFPVGVLVNFCHSI